MRASEIVGKKGKHVGVAGSGWTRVAGEAVGEKEQDGWLGAAGQRLHLRSFGGRAVEPSIGDLEAGFRTVKGARGPVQGG